MEWSADCNGDGIVDYGQCQDGSLADANANNIPDCCESGDPCVADAAPGQWRVEDGGNGHWYTLIPRQSQSWDELRAAAVSVGAQLACIGDSTENGFVRSINGATNSALGGLRPRGVCAAPWLWIDGSAFTYTNWDSSQPDCGTEEIVVMYPSGVWHDYPRSGHLTGWAGATLEWSADCNADGIVAADDLGSLLAGWGACP